ncbi:MAG TPA: 4'-phosphopantetheinyl transferase superfamily protein [Smithellaceae bacterium]
MDLREPANAGKSRDSRFLKKILTSAEIEFVQTAENPDATLWSLWACKETAYKVIKKSCVDAAFLPRQWQIIFNKSESKCIDGKMIIPGKDGVYIRLFSNSHYTHCIGTDCLWALDKLICNVDVLPEEKDGENIDPSLFSRKCLGQNLAKFFCLNFQDIEITRVKMNGALQPPHVCVGGRKTDMDVSLSHDGQFVAYAFYPDCAIINKIKKTSVKIRNHKKIL